VAGRGGGDAEGMRRSMKVLTGQKDFFLIVVGDLNEILQDLSISVKIFQVLASSSKI
jgi:hypothetical protein